MYDIMLNGDSDLNSTCYYRVKSNYIVCTLSNEFEDTVNHVTIICHTNDKGN